MKMFARGEYTRHRPGISLLKRRTWYADEEGEEEEDQEESEDQEDQNSEIDWDNIKPDDIPFDLLKEHPSFRELRDEAAQRRVRNKELNQKLEAMLEQDGENDEEAPTTQQAPKELIELIQHMNNQLAELQEQSVRSKEQAQLDNLTSQYKLSDEDVSLLRTVPSENREKFAKRLAKRQPDGNTSSGNPGAPAGYDSRADFLRKKIRGGDEDVSPLDANVHQLKGGGWVTKD